MLQRGIKLKSAWNPSVPCQEKQVCDTEEGAKQHYMAALNWLGQGMEMINQADTKDLDSIADTVLADEKA